MPLGVWPVLGDCQEGWNPGLRPVWSPHESICGGRSGALVGPPWACRGVLAGADAGCRSSVSAFISPCDNKTPKAHVPVSTALWKHALLGEMVMTNEVETSMGKSDYTERGASGGRIITPARGDPCCSHSISIPVAEPQDFSPAHSTHFHCRRRGFQQSRAVEVSSARPGSHIPRLAKVDIDDDDTGV